jgi:hypothetical protein
LIWIGVGIAIFAAYWICLRYLFPGYFAPLSAFHVDFFEYASLRDKSLAQILRYPRPAAYYSMKLLGQGGLYSAMAGGIAVALGGVMLTVYLAVQMAGISLRALVLAACFYSVLLFAHPDFYFEHRHDLPAEVSYLFAIGSLICWNLFLRRHRIWLPIAAVCLAVLFVFAKETYFGSVLCLVFGMAILDRPNWRWHVGFLVLLAGLEGASFLWTAHLNGPFVNTHAAAENSYRIDASVASVVKISWFYLSRLFNPLLLVVLGWALFLLRDRGRVLGVAAVFVVAGLAAFGPHALLPNHVFEEYAWVPAPLVLAPVLLIGPGKKLWPAGVMAGLVALVLFAPWGYGPGYRSPEVTYELRQDVIGRNIARSIKQLHAIPAGSRVLVVGLDATYIPFHSESFLLAEFGEHISWTVLAGPGITPRKTNRVTRVVSVGEVNFDSFDRLVTYDSDGNLQSIRAIRSIPTAERAKPYLLVPRLRPAAELTEMYPREAYRKFIAANVCLDWGLWSEAQRYLDGAADNGAGGDATFQQLSTRLKAGLAEEAAALTVSTALAARPEHIIDTDGSGLGETELVWTISPPRQCEIRVGAPDGKLFSVASASGSQKTEKWVRNGMTFFLQDVSAGRTLAPENTLAQVTVEVSRR